MKRLTLLFSVLWGVIGVLGLAGPSVLGADIWWDACDDAWFTTANWIPSRLPTAADTVYIDNGCGGPLITKGDAFAKIVYVGMDIGGNTICQTGFTANTLTVNGLILGSAVGSEGTYTLSGAGQLSVGGSNEYAYIGLYGNGTFKQSGGKATFYSYLFLGDSPGAVGVYEMSGGEADFRGDVLFGRCYYDAPGDPAKVGMGGTGIFRHSGGKVKMAVIGLSGMGSTYELSGTGELTVSPYYVYISGIWPDKPNSFVQRGGIHTTGGITICAEKPDGTANYTLTGGTLSVTGTGGVFSNINVQTGSQFIQSGGSNTVVGYVNIDYGAVYELSGTGVLSMADLQVGSQSTSGRFMQSGGVNTVQGNLYLGQKCSSIGGGPTVGRYELSGDGQLSVQGSEIVGQDFGNPQNPNSRGDFVQTGGSHVVQSFVYLGNDKNITGTYTMSDGELQVNILWVGYKGNGEFTQTGGTVGAGRLDIGRDPGSEGWFTLDQAGQLIVDDRLTVGRSGTGVMELNGGKVATRSFSIGRYTGQGALSLTPDAEVVVTQELVLGSKASFGAEPGSKIFMEFDTETNSAASFQNLSQDPSKLSGLGSLELCFEGGADLAGTLEIAGNDVGAEEMGFLSNFGLGVLRVGTDLSPAQVKLVDDTDNGTGGPGLEVLYVDRIVVSSGSILDVNGRLVYYHTLCNSGGTIELNGGSLIQVGIPGDLDHDGDMDMFDLAGFVDNWLWEGLDGGVPADLACGGDVDMLDFAILASHWLEQ